MDRGTATSIGQESSSARVSPHSLLAVGECKRSGLILCKSHYAEFAGPGAAIGSPGERAYTSVIALGDPELVELETYEDRQKAYSRRIQWVRWLHKIVAQTEPHQRIDKLLSGFEEFFGSEILAQVPHEPLALLAGVLPQTIAAARSQPYEVDTFSKLIREHGNVVIVDRQSFPAAGGRSSSQLRQNLKRALDCFPRSA